MSVKTFVARRLIGEFGRISFLLCILGALSAFCPSSRSVAGSSLRLSNLVGVWNQGAAIADLDGDGRPDLAIVREAGSSPDGSQYRIELHLTTRPTVSYLNIGAEKGGLQIVPRDVDGDRDLDLIIAGAASDRAVGVWINDSKGGFTQGEAHAYPRTLWTEITETVSYIPQHLLQAMLAQPSRYFIATPSADGFSSRLLSQLRSSFIPTILPAAPIDQARTRAPPRPVRSIDT